MHESALSGHSEVNGSYQRANSVFYWPNMRKQIIDFVMACDIYKMNKSENVASPGLLKSLPIPHQAWTHIAIDFIEGLPKSEGKDTNFVVVDKFTKYIHFIGLSHPYTTISVAKVFMDNVYKLYGMPLSIVSDRDRIFTSTFWQEFFKLARTSLHMSTTYHP